jgi:hypothetical protein
MMQQKEFSEILSSEYLPAVFERGLIDKLYGLYSGSKRLSKRFQDIYFNTSFYDDKELADLINLTERKRIAHGTKLSARVHGSGLEVIVCTQESEKIRPWEHLSLYRSPSDQVRCISTAFDGPDAVSFTVTYIEDDNLISQNIGIRKEGGLVMSETKKPAGKAEKDLFDQYNILTDPETRAIYREVSEKRNFNHFKDTCELRFTMRPVYKSNAGDKHESRLIPFVESLRDLFQVLGDKKASTEIIERNNLYIKGETLIPGEGEILKYILEVSPVFSQSSFDADAPYARPLEHAYRGKQVYYNAMWKNNPLVTGNELVRKMTYRGFRSLAAPTAG